MGAWDTDAFGNDTATEWAEGLAASDDLGLIEKTLDNLLDADDEYVEAYLSEEAVAAAETIARLKGHFGVRNEYTENVDKWVEAHTDLDVSQELVDKALMAIDRATGNNSELPELFRDGEWYDDWVTAIEDLKARLA